MRWKRKRHKTFLRVCKLEISFQTLSLPCHSTLLAVAPSLSTEMPESETKESPLRQQPEGEGEGQSVRPNIDHHPAVTRWEGNLHKRERKSP